MSRTLEDFTKLLDKFGEDTEEMERHSSAVNVAKADMSRADVLAVYGRLERERDAACEETRNVFCGLVKIAENYGKLQKRVAELEAALGKGAGSD